MYVYTHLFLIYIYKFINMQYPFLAKVALVFLCFWSHKPNCCLWWISWSRSFPSPHAAPAVQNSPVWNNFPLCCLLDLMCFVFVGQTVCEGKKCWANTNPLNILGLTLPALRGSWLNRDYSHWRNEQTLQPPVIKLISTQTCEDGWVEMKKDNICACF